MNSQKLVFLSFLLVCILVSLARAEVDQAYSKPQTKEEELYKENGGNQHVVYNEETDHEDDVNYKSGGETYEEDRGQIVDDHEGYNIESDDWGRYEKYGDGAVRGSLSWGGGRGGGSWGAFGGGHGGLGGGGRGYGGGQGGRGGGGGRGFGGGRGGGGGRGFGGGHGGGGGRGYGGGHGGRGGGGPGYGGGRGGRWGGGGPGHGGMSP